MTLEEAIIHCKEKACGDTECSKEHLQLAIWLEELQALREHLPSNLDEAAVKSKVKEIFDSLPKYDISEEQKNRVEFGLLALEAFALIFYDTGRQAGAEWMVNQHLELTWKDVVLFRTIFDAMDSEAEHGKLEVSLMTKDYYEEVLKRFLEKKRTKQ